MKVFSSLFALSVAAVLVGCSSLPDTTYSKRSEQTLTELKPWSQTPEQGVAAQTLVELIDLPVVSDLIAEALANNPGVQQTLITLQQARLRQTSVGADQLPQVSATLQGVNAEASQTRYATDITVSWELDLWQKLADSTDAASFAAQASAADYLAAQNTLAASVIQGYLEVIAQQQLIAIERQRLEVLQNSESIILTRYRNGLGSLNDLDTARTSSATSQANLAEYQNNLQTAQRNLAVLIGRPQPDLDALVTAQTFPEVVAPLPGMSQQNLAQRPDLISAYQSLLSTESTQQAAYKALLPSLNISGALSDEGLSPSAALLKDPVWTLLGSLTAPLFQGGKLKANAQIAELDTVNSWWVYQETLLNAVQEVEDTLSLEQSLSVRQNHLRQALANATRSAQSYANQYRQGLVDILDLLSVYQTRFDLQAQLVQLQRNQLSNRIDLGQALGLGVSS